MKPQTSRRNPPQTGYVRPTEPKFWIWQEYIGRGADPRWCERRGWERYLWRWCCTFCDPPSYGAQRRLGALQRILFSTMPSHMSHRRSHHEHVARRRP